MQTSSCHIPRVCQFLLIIVLTLMMFTPAYVKADMSAVAGGNYHTIAIRDDGTVWAWGSNGYGQLGDGTTATYKKIPVQVSGLMDVTAIAGGEAHTAALKSDDTVWTWGKNNKGQLGDGSTVSYSKTPVQVSGLTSVIEIASVFNHTIALKSNSTVWTWGDNGEGQLGDRTTTYRSTPVQVSGLSDATAIAAGYWHSISLKSDGTAWAWGYNFYGQLGDGTKTDSNTPVQVSGLNNVIAIAGRSRSTAALKSDGTVWSWGSNSNGQLGDGSTVSYSKTPVQASGLTDVIAIACGAYHAVALRDDATVWAWGSNEYGQLGDGTTTDRNTPVEVSGLTNVIAISCGNRHSIALKSDGTVWAWGRNNKSQLGDGTTEDRYTPVKVVFSDFSTTTTTTPDDTTTTTVPDDITTSTTIPEGAFHLGDVNRDDDITSIDAAMTMQIVDGTLSPTPDQLTVADADQDGEVTTEDTEMIIRWASEKCKLITRKTIGPEGGILELNNLNLIISPNAFTKGETITIKEVDTYPTTHETLEPLGSFYRLNNFPPIEGPITVELYFNPSTVSEEDAVLIYMGSKSSTTEESYEFENGHLLLDTEVNRGNGTATIQIDPFQPNPALVPTSNRKKPFNWTLHIGNYEMILGLGWIPAPRPYYIVYDEDFKVLSWFLNPLPDYSKKVKDALHVAKDKLKNLSFSVESMHKPTEVYINEIPDRSSFVWGEAKYPWPLPPFIVLTPDIADDDLREAAGHELFHVVQSLYGNNYLWLMEASSAWFEAKVSKDVDFYPGKVKENKNFIYHSLENGDNTKDSRRHGYGASSFLTYLTDKAGYQDDLILTIHKKIANNEDQGCGVGALESALGGSSILSKEFREFTFEYITQTTGFSKWPEPDPRTTIEVSVDGSVKKLTPKISVLSAWNCKVNPPYGFEKKINYNLIVSLEANSPVIKGAVYTKNNTTWQLECEFPSGETCILPKFYGKDGKRSANVVLVNNQAEYPYNQVASCTLNISLKEEEETTTLPYGQNLLVNPGAEEGPYYDHETNENCKKIEHWSGASEGGNGCVREYDWYLQKTADDDRMELGENFPPPDGGQYAFSCWNNTNCNTFYTQRVDVSMFYEDIDAGRVTAEVSVWWGGMAGLWIYSPPEFTCSLIPEWVIGPSREDLDKKTSMKYYEEYIQVPTGTRSIDIEAFFRTSFACVDNMSLKLHK